MLERSSLADNNLVINLSKPRHGNCMHITICEFYFYCHLFEVKLVYQLIFWPLVLAKMCMVLSKTHLKMPAIFSLRHIIDSPRHPPSTPERANNEPFIFCDNFLEHLRSIRFCVIVSFCHCRFVVLSTPWQIAKLPNRPKLHTPTTMRAHIHFHFGA